MQPLLIDHDDALDFGLHALLELDPKLKPLLALSGRPPLRKRAPGFPGLAGIIVSQQVSTASAASIWARITAEFPALAPAHILESDDLRLKALGLSAPKIRTLRATADAVVTGALPLDTLHRLEAEEAVQALTAVKGIGPWTADIYLLFCLGHSDAFPAGDLALQEAARVGFRMRARPDAAKLEKLARRWRPYRGVAAKLLWAYYRVMKAGREAAPAGD
jgi:DNA-3-methyladenine glycosylase II